MTTLSTTDLAAAGRFLYGSLWQTALADDLRVNVRTVQRWASGAITVPPGAEKEILEIAAAKHLTRVTEVLAMVAKKNGMPKSITLSVSGCDSKVASMHPRDWTEDTDRKINTALAALLKELGIDAIVE